MRFMCLSKCSHHIFPRENRFFVNRGVNEDQAQLPFFIQRLGDELIRQSDLSTSTSISARTCSLIRICRPEAIGGLRGSTIKSANE